MKDLNSPERNAHRPTNCIARTAARDSLQGPHALITRRGLLLSIACIALVPRVRAAAEEQQPSVSDMEHALAPAIIVNSPRTSSPITGPVRIDVEFVPAGKVPIDPGSFKVSYGMLGIDITDRVRRYATVTAQGIMADLPSLPKGRHTFEIQISDVLKRSAHIRLRCEVAG
jgi:hypothetical protein